MSKYRIALGIGTAIFFLVFCWLGLSRHWGYMTSIIDLGCFDQPIWSASQGKGLIYTSHPLGTMNWLGFHFQPILYLFVPLYWVVPSVYWLIFAQAAALSFSALPLFLVARHITGSEKQALLWALIYLANPFVISAAAWDFQPASLAAFFLSLALLAVVKNNLPLLVTAGILLLTCKENMGLTVAGLGLLNAMVNNKWLPSLGICLLGIGTTALVLGVIMPHYSLLGQHPMLSSTNEGRYQWLGSSLSEITQKLLLSPGEVIKTLILSMGGGNYVMLLLLPAFFFPLAVPAWLLPSLGDFAANVLSGNPMPRSVMSYHSAPIIPAIVVAAICGFERCKKYFKLLNRPLTVKLILACNLIFAYRFAPFPLPGSANLWSPVKVVATFDKRESVIKEIIGDRSISVQTNVGAHFTEREFVHRFPEKLGSVDFVVLRLESPTFRLAPNDPAYLGTLAHHLNMAPTSYLDRVEELLNSQVYQPIYWSEPWLVLGKKLKPVEAAALGDIHNRLRRLRRQWTDG